MDQYEDIDIFEIDEALPPSKDVVDMDSGFDKLGKFMTTPGNLPYPEFLSPMYKVIAQGTDKVYDFSERLKELGPLTRQMLPGGNIAYLIGQYGVGENIPKTFAKMELGEPITPLEGLEATLIGLDLTGVYAGGKVLAKGAYNNIIKMLSKKGVSEEAAASLATKALVSDPKLIDEYAGAKDVEELSDEAKDKLGVGASLTPKQVKNIANKTMKEKGYTDIYGQPESVSLASDLYSPGNKILQERSKYMETVEPMYARILQTSKTQSGGNLDEVKGYANLQADKYGDKNLVKFLSNEYDDAVEVINSIPEFKIQKTGETYKERFVPRKDMDKAAKIYADIVNGDDEVLKIALANVYPTDKPRVAGAATSIGYKIQNKAKSLINDFSAWTDFKRKHPLRSGASLEKTKRLNLAVDAIDAYKKNNPKSVGIEINLKKLEEILSPIEEYKDVFRKIDDDILEKKFLDKTGENYKNLTLEEKRLLALRAARPGEFTAIREYLKQSGLPLARPLSLRKELFGNKFKKIKLDLSDLQKVVYQNKQKETYEIINDLADIPIDGSQKVKDWLRSTTQRMKANYTTEDEIINQVQKIDSQKLANLILKREKANLQADAFMDEYEDIAKVFDGDFNPAAFEFQLGHIKALEDSINASLDMENLMVISKEANLLDNEVRNYVKTKINQINEQMSKGLTRDNFSKVESLIDDLKQIDEIAKEEGVLTSIKGQTFGDETLKESESIFSGDEGLFMAQGGMAKNFSYGGGVTEDLDIFEAQEDSFPEGSYQTANLMIPFFKLFGKAPPHTTAPIPTPKEKLVNPTKKQKESLESETIKRAQEDVFDPTPNDSLGIAIEKPITITPITKQPMTSVFYSDVDRLLSRPDTPKTFNSKQEFFDFLNKNNIRKSESTDYRIPQILKLFGDNDPIDTATILTQIRTAPISGMRVHATGQGSDIINPNGASSTRYTGYAENGFIEGSQRERILYINRNQLPGDSGDYPQSMFGGENISRHDFGIPNEENTYIVGWTRLTDRYGYVPPKVTGPETQINLRQTTKELNKNKKSLKGLYAEARSKLARLANQRGMSQADINDIDIDFGSDTPKLSVIAKYADQLDEISPGLVDQMDELIVKNRGLQEQINKASGVDPSGVVRVTFADEIQSDILQAAAMRKQQLAAALRKIQEEGKESTNLQGLNRVSEAALNFFEENKSVFRPLEKSPEEMKLLNKQMLKLDEEVDNLVNKYIATRELDDAELARLGTLLNDNIDKMLNEVMTIDGATMSGLFPDLPLKNREEWADALIKKDLYELAYRKFVLKDPNASDYYATSTSQPVIKRYGFEGDAATSKELRDLDKQQRFDTFKNTGEFKSSKYKGIGMDEFYGGPNAVDENGKHYTSTIEKILKKQAKENNSEVITMPVQLKKGSKSQYQVTDQNGNMVATLTNEDQARELMRTNPNYQIKPISIPDKKSMEPVFAIKITEEMLESFATHKAKGGLVSNIDIFEVA
jgi:hypothetical protein